MGVMEAHWVGEVRGDELIRLGSRLLPAKAWAGARKSAASSPALMLKKTSCHLRSWRRAVFSPSNRFSSFSNLKERRTSQGTKLSGGEQQMLAIGRILRTGAAALLDEPTEGWLQSSCRRSAVIRKLKGMGYTIVLVEQNFHAAATVADRHYIVEQGRVVDEIANSDLEEPRQAAPVPGRLVCRRETGEE